MFKRIISTCLILAFAIAIFCIPVSAEETDLRSIYDGFLTTEEAFALTSISPDVVEAAGLSTYHLWRILPWLYEQAGIDVGFPDNHLSSQGAIGQIFYQPSGAPFWQVRSLWETDSTQTYFVNQFTGLRGGNAKFQASQVTYSNFNWTVGDLFIGTSSDSSVNYVAMYQGQYFLSFHVSSGSQTVSLETMRDIFDRDYRYFAVIRPQKLCGDFKILNYNNHISSIRVDAENDICTVRFDPAICGLMLDDVRGITYLPGQANAYMQVPTSRIGGAHFAIPGSYMTGYLLDLKNIPRGSEITTSGYLELQQASTYDYNSDSVDGTALLSVNYFNERFEIVDSQSFDIAKFSMTYESYLFQWNYKFNLEWPDDAVYMSYNASFNCRGYSGSGSSSVPIYCHIDLGSLNMSISSLYRLNDSTSFVGDVLWDAINGQYKPLPPSGSGVVGDLGAAEDGIIGGSADGREELKDVLNNAYDPILGHGSGFIFLAYIVSEFVHIRWIHDILVVSLALGIFAFLTNIFASLGRGRGQGKT